MTERLYRHDVYMTECTATITHVTHDSSHAFIEFDRSVFFPEGGGQSCDIGTLQLMRCAHDEITASAGTAANNSVNSKNKARECSNLHDACIFNVTDVQENDDRIIHTVETDTSDIFSIGDTVSMKIDWEHRFDNMQRHCGEHILSGVFYREFGGVNRGFHMGDDYMTIDISLEDDPTYNEITWEMAKHAELCANEVIWSNAPVTVHYFETKKAAESFPVRKKLEIEKDITIVCVGDPSNPSDSVACCGTHPAYAGQIGLVKIFKVEPNKGMFRIYCEAGKRAYLDYEKKHDIITAIGNKYSAGTDDLLDKISSHDEKNRLMRQELSAMRRKLSEMHIHEIENDLTALDKHDASSVQASGNAAGTSPMYTRIYDELRADDLMTIGKAFIGKSNRLIALATLSENVVMLFSNGKSFDCGKLIKENAHIYNGKGGGRADNARAFFPNHEYLETFLDLLEKHLR